MSFTREVEVIASTLQPASTINTFTFTLPAPNIPLASTPSGDLLRASVLSNADKRSSAATFAYSYAEDPFVRFSSAYLGPPSLLGHPVHNNPQGVSGGHSGDNQSTSSTVTYHGVCLTVWSHADAERSNAIRRTLEAGRSRKESAQSMVASRLKNLRADVSGSASDNQDPTSQARRSAKRSSRVCEVCCSQLLCWNVRLTSVPDCTCTDRQSPFLLKIPHHAWSMFCKNIKIFLFLTMGQIAVSTTKYLVELRGWNGIVLPAVHSRDAKIYIDDPGPWIMGRRHQSEGRQNCSKGLGNSAKSM